MSVALFPKFSNFPNLPKFSIDCTPCPPPLAPRVARPQSRATPFARGRSRCTLARKISFSNFGSLTFGTPIFLFFTYFY